jgi:hypothetical protein
MRKVFVVLFGLILSAFMVSCSETTTPTPRPQTFEIVTASLPAGCTCTPYHAKLEATGGKTPYTWALADGSDPLPAGLSMTAQGEITGLLDAAGEWTVTVQCTDDSDTPKTDSQEYTISIDVPSNPSLGIFFDGGATVCSANTAAFSLLSCYVYIILDAESVNCCMATEFMIDLQDADGNSLEAGTDYGIVNVTYPSSVSIHTGDPFSGISIAYKIPQFSTSPVLAMSFDLMLLENLSELSFVFGPDPASDQTQPAVAICDQFHSIVEIAGRNAAVNYPITQ